MTGDRPEGDPGVPEPGPARGRRPPRARVSVERLARRRDRALEGLAWLGRAPDARASLTYRAVRLLARLVLFGLFRFRVATSGQEHLPSGGGYLLVAAAHRGWMDVFLVAHALPTEPRVWFLGSAASAFSSRSREWLLRRVGGLLPVWRGGIGVDTHVESARAVLGAGAVFAQMPEGTVSGPPGRPGPFRTGTAVIALRTGAPIVLLAMAGTEELYLGRRMASRVLPATSVPELLGGEWDGVRPAEGSREELALARRISDAFAARLGPEVEALHRATADPPERARRLRRHLTWLFLAPGPLDRE